MRVIEERDARTKNRKECKRIFDNKYSLGVFPASDGRYRLLDEGLVTYADGSPQMYIKKGVIDKIVENMSDDYEGSINFGHHDLATDPISIIGEWKKSDLIVSDSEEDDGRKVLDVELHLYDDHIYVQQLKRQPYTYGLSAEFYAELDMDASYDLGLPVIESIDLLDFAIVGECGNVNSSDIHLKGEDELKSLKEWLAAHKKPEEEPEELAVSEINDDAEEEEDNDEELNLAVEEEEKDDFVEVVETLSSELEALRSENQTLKQQLSDLSSKYDETFEKIKNLTLDVGTSGFPKNSEPERKLRNGIGEL